MGIYVFPLQVREGGDAGSDAQHGVARTSRHEEGEYIKGQRRKALHVIVEEAASLAVWPTYKTYFRIQMAIIVTGPPSPSSATSGHLVGLAIIVW